MSPTPWGQHRADDRAAFQRMHSFSYRLESKFPKAQLLEDLERIKQLCEEVEEELKNLEG